jgi:hypothetical protein
MVDGDMTPKNQRSRAVLVVNYDLLGELLGLPAGVRILLVNGNDHSAEAKIMVEGEGDRFVYQWAPGYNVLNKIVFCKEDITEGLAR